ncbi:MAG: glycosyltransferase [bacterium]|nr:glycosyltransferase [bacterium]
MIDAISITLLVATGLYIAIAVAFTLGLFRSPVRTARQENPPPFVSVVIAARNEADQIGPCLEGLIRQTYPSDRFEVLVVNDGSQDQTAQIVSDYTGPESNIYGLDVGSAFPDLAAKKRPMSVGIEAARGDIILTTDADCRPLPTWISGMVACFQPDVGAVIGFSQLKLPGSPLTFFERLQALDFLALMSAAAGAANLGVPLAASGQNLAYRKTLFERVGGFREIGHRPSGDDVLLLQLMRKAKSGRIVFATHPETFISTWRSESPTGFWQQRKRWASNAPVQFRLNPPFFAYIASIFLINLLAPVGLLTGWTWFGGNLALCCWIGKALADTLVICRAARRFGRTDLLFLLPVWECLQVPYTILIGLAGSLGRFTWKGRQHAARIRRFQHTHREREQPDAAM